MKSLRKIAELADRFEYRLSRRAQELGEAIPLEAPQVSQAGTTELFFDSADKQKEFAAAIQNPGGPVYKAMEKIWKKLNGAQTVSFDLKINSIPNKGASWIWSIQPHTDVKTAIDAVFQSVVHTTMDEKRKSADAKAKAGGGDGKTLDVGSLEMPAA